MAEKSYFWNSFPDASNPTGYDRPFNADHISDWLEVVMTTGVIKSNTGLKVTPAGGLSVSVNVGKAVIYGKPYRNDSAKAITIDTAPTGTDARIDFIVLRFDRSDAVRNTYLAYKKGTGATAPALIRNDIIYELALAKLTIAPFETEITATDIEDLRGDNETVVITTTGQSRGYCPYMTAVKGYDNYYDAIVIEYKDVITLTAQGRLVTFDIPQYGWTGVDILEVYTNGIKERESAYTVNGNVITFTNEKAPGTVIEVIVKKFIDGEGLGTVLEQYEDLQARVLRLSSVDKYQYVCNGANDNIVISQIAQAFITGTYDAGSITQNAADFLEKWGGPAGIAALPADVSIKINIYGNFKASAPYAGTGTSISGYQWLSLGGSTATTKRLVFDFSNVQKLNFNCTANAKNIIFFGQDVHIIGANVAASCYGAGGDINMFSGISGDIVAENCNFEIITTGAAQISESGLFENCNTFISTANSSAYTFNPRSSALPVMVYGGSHRAYCASTAQSSIVFNIATGGTNAIIMAFGVRCPTVARDGFRQTHCASAGAGKIYISGVNTKLTITGANVEYSGHTSLQA